MRTAFVPQRDTLTSRPLRTRLATAAGALLRRQSLRLCGLLLGGALMLPGCASGPQVSDFAENGGPSGQAGSAPHALVDVLESETPSETPPTRTASVPSDDAPAGGIRGLFARREKEQTPSTTPTDRDPFVGLEEQLAASEPQPALRRSAKPTRKPLLQTEQAASDEDLASNVFAADFAQHMQALEQNTPPTPEKREPTVEQGANPFAALDASRAKPPVSQASSSTSELPAFDSSTDETPSVTDTTDPAPNATDPEENPFAVASAEPTPDATTETNNTAFPWAGDEPLGAARQPEPELSSEPQAEPPTHPFLVERSEESAGEANRNVGPIFTSPSPLPESNPTPPADFVTRPAPTPARNTTPIPQPESTPLVADASPESNVSPTRSVDPTYVANQSAFWLNRAAGGWDTYLPQRSGPTADPSPTLAPTPEPIAAIAPESEPPVDRATLSQPPAEVIVATPEPEVQVISEPDAAMIIGSERVASRVFTAIGEDDRQSTADWIRTLRRQDNSEPREESPTSTPPGITHSVDVAETDIHRDAPSANVSTSGPSLMAPSFDAPEPETQVEPEAIVFAETDSDRELQSRLEMNPERVVPQRPSAGPQLLAAPTPQIDAGVEAESAPQFPTLFAPTPVPTAERPREPQPFPALSVEGTERNPFVSGESEPEPEMIALLPVPTQPVPTAEEQTTDDAPQQQLPDLAWNRPSAEAAAEAQDQPWKNPLWALVGVILAGTVLLWQRFRSLTVPPDGDSNSE